MSKYGDEYVKKTQKRGYTIKPGMWASKRQNRRSWESKEKVRGNIVSGA